MASPSSSSTSRCEYDVFLSFRGEDTRTNFSDHLYDALKRYGICVFRDHNELERGEEIRSELLRAIENSRCSVVVFSKNYASSTWCLDELAHIMMCRDKLGRMVLPVFYHVEPADVRKQKGSFKEAFAGHEERFKGDTEKLEKWRKALEEAASLKGEDVGNRYESRVIADIVQGISHNLGRKMLTTPLNPVGLDYRADRVISLLNDMTKEVLMVGIYGMGGLGKTTIAKEVFNRVCQEFQGSCFLANVREKSDHKRIVVLIKQLLSQTLKGDHEEVYDEHRGLKVIEERLCCMRVLIVLDDVDKWEQVDKILGDRSWLFPGSRIIVTTRRKDLLEAYPQYQVAGLDDKESLRLLCINAFNQWHPKEEYMECTKSVVNYVGGIPLALIVLGKFLAGKSVKNWEVYLKKLRVYANEDIQKILEISYHSLDDAQRNLFLDIACFFIGEDKDYITSILDGCHDSFADDGIDTLVKRCLVKIVEIRSHNEIVMDDLLPDTGREIVRKENSCPEIRTRVWRCEDASDMLLDKTIVMHDLLRDMGREIVRKENSCPEKRTRVWHWKDASDVLLDKTGTNKVEGLRLNPPESSEFSTEGFRKMTKLRLLQLDNVNLNGSYGHISKKLRWLCWLKCPLESMPTDLYLDNVVALDMRYSRLTQVWEEVKFLQKLKVLDLSHSCKLTRTPNFEGFPNLEILMLEFCAELVEVHESIGRLTKLGTLNLKDCKNLTDLPRGIFLLRSLKYLILSGCSELDELPNELLGYLESLVVLNADRTAISRISFTPSNEQLRNLRMLSARNARSTTIALRKEYFGKLRALSLRITGSLFTIINCNVRNCGSLFVADTQRVEHKFCPWQRPLWIEVYGKRFSILDSYHGLSECERLQSVPKHDQELWVEATNNPSLEKRELDELATSAMDGS